MGIEQGPGEQDQAGFSGKELANELTESPLYHAEAKYREAQDTARLIAQNAPDSVEGDRAMRRASEHVKQSAAERDTERAAGTEQAG